MSLIEWRQEFAIGAPGVDHEHRELIALINRLHAALGQARGRDPVLGFLAELHDRIASHFALEEKLMRETGYDQYQDHKADHERLLDEIRDIMDACEGREALDEARLAQELESWFMQHFRTRDARLHKFGPIGGS